jgi:hypothetical protein
MEFKCKNFVSKFIITKKIYLTNLFTKKKRGDSILTIYIKKQTIHENQILVLFARPIQYLEEIE